MIRIGGTFPGECHLQESESDYSKVKVMTNNKRMGAPSRENVISITSSTDCTSADKRNLGWGQMNYFQWQKFGRKYSHKYSDKSQNKVILKTFGANIYLIGLHQSGLDVSDTCPAQCAVKQILN